MVISGVDDGDHLVYMLNCRGQIWLPQLALLRLLLF